VIEINQTRAMVGGVTSGDAPGFPVAIWESGSCRLTSNLDVSAESPINVILISAPDVTLDLNGFSLIGPTVCTGDPLECTPTASAHGIVTTPAAEGVTVKNGAVRGIWGFGVILQGDGSRVQNVRAISNGADGIVIRAAGMVTESVASSNGGNGIFSSEGSSVLGCVVEGNGGVGIALSFGSSVFDSVSRSNRLTGISPGLEGGFAGNVATDNGTQTAGGVRIACNLEGASVVCP
jgi:hypothetical protein